MDIHFVIWYTRNNYTGAHRDFPNILKTIQPPFLMKTFNWIKFILTVGTQNIFNGGFSRKNYSKHQKCGNHSTVTRYVKKIKNISNKEQRNKYLLAVISCVRRFISNLHTTPQLLIIILDKKN